MEDSEGIKPGQVEFLSLKSFLITSLLTRLVVEEFLFL